AKPQYEPSSSFQPAAAMSSGSAHIPRARGWLVDQAACACFMLASLIRNLLDFEDGYSGADEREVLRLAGLDAVEGQRHARRGPGGVRDDELLAGVDREGRHAEACGVEGRESRRHDNDAALAAVEGLELEAVVVVGREQVDRVGKLAAAHRIRQGHDVGAL